MARSSPQEITDQIIERTDERFLLFVEELTKAVIESGVIAEAGDTYQLNREANTDSYPDLATWLATGPA